MASAPMTMHIGTRSASEIRVPFHVGDNRPQTWMLTLTEQGLRWKHDHRQGDGSAGGLTQNDGDTINEGSATHREFPLDAPSIGLFSANDRRDSTTNAWAVEIDVDRSAQELHSTERISTARWTGSTRIDPFSLLAY